MKKLATLPAVIAILFVMSGKAQAVPMYYTFEGTVTIITSDNAGAIATAGLSAGGAVDYTFVVDFDANGFWTQNDGTVNTTAANAYYDPFYAGYISGDALEQVDGGIYNADGWAAEMNIGYDCLIGNCGAIASNSDDDLLYIFSNSEGMSDWSIGSTLIGFNYAIDSNGALSQLFSDLTLTDISPVSVPEPSTLLLLGSGMLGLLAFRRRLVPVRA